MPLSKSEKQNMYKKYKITHVYKGGKYRWSVRINDKKINITHYDIIKYNLLTNDTTYDMVRKSCILRKNIKSPPFRYVYWNGFKEPTKESVNIKFTTYEN